MTACGPIPSGRAAEPARPSEDQEHIQQVIAEMFDEPPDRDPWQCAEIPGFLLLSREPSAALEQAAGDILRATRRLAAILPPPDWLPQPPPVLMVVLFNRPPDENEGMVRRTVGALVALSPGVAALNTWSPHVAAGSRTSGSNARWSLAKSAALSYTQRRFAAAHPKLPRWFHSGFIQLLSRIEPSAGDDLQFRRSDIRPSPRSGRPPWTGRDLPAIVPWTTLEVPMREVLVSDEASIRRARTDPTFAEHAQREAWLFAHWGLGFGPERRAAFWAFVKSAAETPPSESELRRHFGLTFAQLDVALSDLLIEGNGGIPAARVPVSLQSTQARELNVRPAGAGEIELLRRELEKLSPN